MQRSQQSTLQPSGLLSRLASVNDGINGGCGLFVSEEICSARNPVDRNWQRLGDLVRPEAE